MRLAILTSLARDSIVKCRSGKFARSAKQRVQHPGTGTRYAALFRFSQIFPSRMARMYVDRGWRSSLGPGGASHRGLEFSPKRAHPSSSLVRSCFAVLHHVPPRMWTSSLDTIANGASWFIETFAIPSARSCRSRRFVSPVSGVAQYPARL